MAIEKLDNWELVIKGSDLEDGKFRLEDWQKTCALVREIGTDSPTTIVFGVKDQEYIRIDNLIAPYYHTEYNRNKMRFSLMQNGRWINTGFELPIPLQTYIEIRGLDPDKRIYLRGTLYRNVLEGSHPINLYLIALKGKLSYERVVPLYYRNVEVTEFKPNINYVLRTEDVVAPKFEEWNVNDPKATIVPTTETTYILNEPIEVLWNHPEISEKDVEFRVFWDQTDLKVMPRLDHMILPPSDGRTKYIEEEVLIKTTNFVKNALTADANAGSAVSVTVSGDVSDIYSVGTEVMIADDNNAEIAKVVNIDYDSGTDTTTITLDVLKNSYKTADHAAIYTAAYALREQPIAPVDVIAPNNDVVLVSVATGQVFVKTGHDTEKYTFGYYASRRYGGATTFSLRILPERYRRIEYPHKLAFIFVNKSGVTPTQAGKFTLYTKSIYLVKMPPETRQAYINAKVSAEKWL
ncbi:MAG: hypothetical protein DRP01_01325 [Archaeoglobales archaeon]|nr:MAG: hypothetical protein DRP01_01325 [Archaeoglobales archaeon]